MAVNERLVEQETESVGDFRTAPMPSPEGHLGLQNFADEAARQIADVVIINRLREIRVLLGFHRHTMVKKVEPSLGRKVNFLPAIEVFGEGVFLRINETSLQEWEKSQRVRQSLAG